MKPEWSKWKPASEPPPEWTDVLTVLQLEDNSRTIKQQQFYNGQWAYDQVRPGYKTVAWIKLPKPPTKPFPWRP